MRRKRLFAAGFFLLLSATMVQMSFAQAPPVILGWTQNAEPDIDHYVIYRDEAPGMMTFLDNIPRSDTMYIDQNVTPGQTYYYKLTAVDSMNFESEATDEVIVTVGALTSTGGGEANIIRNFDLQQNYPNPFNPSTTVEFQVPEKSLITITIYDVTGHEVKKLLNEPKDAGTYYVQWNGDDNAGKTVSSGIYFYQMVAKNFRVTKKAIFQK
jgi:hypothetical protein